MEKIIGRETEIELLTDALASPRAELVAVYGRRRVGKTYLIRALYEKNILEGKTGGISTKNRLQKNYFYHLDLHFRCKKQ